MPPQSNPDDPTITNDPSSLETEQKTALSKPDMVGKLIGGRYLIEQELGRGGIGAVYLARDKPELMSRRVVVKVLLEDSLKNEWVVQKFHQEIESLTRLDDPGVVGVFDAGKLEDGSPYLVMQFVDGVSLRAEIKQGGMDLIRTANIMRQIGRTLQVAHTEGVIHRDLKPENIMLRRVTSGEEQVKVIDFGIAKVKNSVVAPSTVTGAGVAGTIGYMPSEQLQAQSITPASDIYALGAIAYEMLTGTRPFNPETGFQLLEMQREGVRVRPKDLRPAIPERAQDIILKSLSFDPKQRYQSAAEFGDALASALTGQGSPLEASTADFGPIGGKSPSDDKGASSQPVSAGQRKSMELAHVLFLDIVGYTRLPIDLQTKTLEQLHETLRGTEDFVRSQESKQLLRLPSGDGMALVFFGDVEAPARCAVEVSKALKSHPDIKLRMGVHSGPVDPIIDVNEIPIVTGAGINTAQRVMDCGDNGHILLSKRIADDLGQYSRWKEHLHDLGEISVKHGERIHIVNLYTDEAGNSELPAKFKPVKKPFPLLAVAAALLVIVIGVTLALWKPWKPKNVLPPPTTRALTYFLTVQKMAKDPKSKEYKPLGGPFPSTGQEIYGNGWEFYVNITPEQSGSLYLLNEGAGAGGAMEFHVLFPTSKNNNSVAGLAAGQAMKAGPYFFNEFNGPPEKIWIVWSTQPLADLDGVFKDAANHKLTITDPAHIKTVRDVLGKYDSNKPDVQSDKSKKQTTVRGTGDVIVSLLELQHEQY